MRTPTNLRLIPTALLAAILTTACSLSPQSPPPATIALRSVALYYHRGHSLGSDFEQFKLDSNRLFIECGAVSGGRHSAKEQRIVALSPEQLDDVKSKAWQVRRYVEELRAQFKASGTGSTIFDPGRLSLELRFDDGSHKIETSFDSIANGTEGREAVVKEVVQAIRAAAGNPPCGKGTFYGLSSRQ